MKKTLAGFLEAHVTLIDKIVVYAIGARSRNIDIGHLRQHV